MKRIYLAVLVLFGLSLLIGLTSCTEPQQRYTKGGVACKQVGYKWYPQEYWMGPDGRLC